MHTMHSIASFLLSSARKVFLTSPSIFRSYERM